MGWRRIGKGETESWVSDEALDALEQSLEIVCQSYLQGKGRLPNHYDLTTLISMTLKGTFPHIKGVEISVEPQSQKARPAPRVGDFFFITLRQDLRGIGRVLVDHHDYGLLVGIYDICTSALPSPDLVRTVTKGKPWAFGPGFVIEEYWRAGDWDSYSNALVEEWEFQCCRYQTTHNGKPLVKTIFADGHEAHRPFTKDDPPDLPYVDIFGKEYVEKALRRHFALEL